MVDMCGVTTSVKVTFDVNLEECDMENSRSTRAEENAAPPFNSSMSEEGTSGQPPPQYECPICLNWLREPILTSCGHRFCNDCIRKWLEQGDHCPVDNVVLKSTDLFFDNFTKREIQQQKIVCPYAVNGCNTQITRVELENHVGSCRFKRTLSTPSPKSSKVFCPYKTFGCQANFKNEEQLAIHNESNIQSHLFLLMGAYRKLTIDRDLDEACSNSKELEALTLWDPSEKQNTSVDSQQEGSEEPQSIRTLLRGLYERVVILEQKNHEQTIAIGNLSRLITALTKNQCHIMEDFPLKYCYGSYLWRIENFTSKLEILLRDSTKMLYSPGFYTSPGGYRFCARINSSPVQPNSLALHLHIMKSENDDCLEWPFHGKISLNLINPTFPQLTQKDHMISKPELAAFQKPLSEMSTRGFGFLSYATADDLKLKGFIAMDCLRIRINVNQNK